LDGGSAPVPNSLPFVPNGDFYDVGKAYRRAVAFRSVYRAGRKSYVTELLQREENVNDLLARALKAHGGLDRWNGYDSLVAKLSTGGSMWAMKRKAGLGDGFTMTLDMHEQQVVTHPFGRPDRRVRFSPDRLTVETAAGVAVETHQHPYDTFTGSTYGSRRGELHAAYFNSYTIWNCLTQPFLYTYPGFETEEIEPWRETDEQWRRLKIRFPDTITTHCREQVSYFAPNGLLRRHDYAMDGMGGIQQADYAGGYKMFRGIIMPTTRKAFLVEPDGSVIREPTLMTIKIESACFS
jgi:hypothetical protein